MTETLSMEDGKHGDTTPDEKEPVFGWGVFRRQPYDFVGLFDTEAEAEAEKQRAGEDYVVAYGAAHVGSNRFEPDERAAE